MTNSNLSPDKLRVPSDWWAGSFYSAEDWRAEALRFDKLADLAKADGDTLHADNAHRNAAGCRQRAREKEALT